MKITVYIEIQATSLASCLVSGGHDFTYEKGPQHVFSISEFDTEDDDYEMLLEEVAADLGANEPEDFLGTWDIE